MLTQNILITAGSRFGTAFKAAELHKNKEVNQMNQLTLTDHTYLYLGSLSEAKRSNEAGLWRASHQCNIACKQAIEAAIRAGFNGMHLKADCCSRMLWKLHRKRWRG